MDIFHYLVDLLLRITVFREPLVCWRSRKEFDFWFRALPGPHACEDLTSTVQRIMRHQSVSFCSDWRSPARRDVIQELNVSKHLSSRKFCAGEGRRSVMKCCYVRRNVFLVGCYLLYLLFNVRVGTLFLHLLRFVDRLSWRHGRGWDSTSLCPSARLNTPLFFTRKCGTGTLWSTLISLSNKYFISKWIFIHFRSSRSLTCIFDLLTLFLKRKVWPVVCYNRKKQKASDSCLHCLLTHSQSPLADPVHQPSPLTRAQCDFITSGLIVFAAPRRALVETVACGRLEGNRRWERRRGRGAEGMSKLLFTGF